LKRIAADFYAFGGFAPETSVYQCRTPIISYLSVWYQGIGDAKAVVPFIKDRIYLHDPVGSPGIEYQAGFDAVVDLHGHDDKPYFGVYLEGYPVAGIFPVAIAE
jgi:hypothetical protein